MAHITTNAVPHRSFIGAILMSVFDWLARASEANARVAQFEKLQAKSDEELAELGMRRDDIARHVFRDVLYI